MKELNLKVKVKYHIEGNIPESIKEDAVITALFNGPRNISAQEYVCTLSNIELLKQPVNELDFEVKIEEIKTTRDE